MILFLSFNHPDAWCTFYGKALRCSTRYDKGWPDDSARWTRRGVPVVEKRTQTSASFGWRWPWAFGGRLLYNHLHHIITHPKQRPKKASGRKHSSAHIKNHTTSNSRCMKLIKTEEGCLRDAASDHQEWWERFSGSFRKSRLIIMFQWQPQKTRTDHNVSVVASESQDWSECFSGSFRKSGLIGMFQWQPQKTRTDHNVSVAASENQDWSECFSGLFRKSRLMRMFQWPLQKIKTDENVSVASSENQD